MLIVNKPLCLLIGLALAASGHAATICLPEEPTAGATVVCSGAGDTWSSYYSSLGGLTFILSTGAIINGVYLAGASNTAIINGTNNGYLTLEGDHARITNNGYTASIWTTGYDARIANYGETQVIDLDGNFYTLNNYGSVSNTVAGGGEDLPFGAVQAMASGSGEINNGIFESTGAVINTTGDYMAGVLVRDPTGPVRISNEVALGEEGEVLARASIFTSGFNAPGIYLVDDVGYIDAPDFNLISNAGTIETEGHQSAAILVEPLYEEIPGSGVTRIENLSTGIIITSGVDAQGIRGYGHDVAVTNAGGILTQNADSAGIEVIAPGAASVWNTHQGTIATEMTFSPGIALAGEPATTGDVPNVVNEGTILTAGSDAPGIVIAGPFHDVDNTCYAEPDCRSMIATTGDGSAGIMLGLVEPSLGIDEPSSGGTVYNGGTISTEGFFAAGIEVIGTVNDVTNGAGGTIDTTGPASFGIEVNGSGNTVTNLGDITTANAASAGIFGTGTGIHVDHMDGSIVTSGDGAKGIAIEGGTGRVEAYSGSSITTGGDSSDGIAVEGGLGRVEAHSGSSITTGGDSAHGIRVTGTQATVDSGSAIQTYGSDAYGMRVSGTDTYARNSGSISTIGDNADGMRVLSSPFSGVNRIRNSGNIATTGAGADGIRASTSYYDIINSGGISTSGSNADGIVVSTLDVEVMDAPVTVVNSGEIWVSGPGSVAVRLEAKILEDTSFANTSTGIVSSGGIAVLGGDGYDEVTNDGEINGDVQLGAAVDRFVRGPGSVVDGMIDGGDDDDNLFLISFGAEEVVNGSQFVNFENNVVAGGGIVTLEGTLSVDTTLVDGTTLNVTDTLDSFVSVINGGKLGGTGLVTGDVDSVSGSVAPGMSIGELAIGGDLLLSGGSLEIEANSLAELDKLLVSGNASLSDGFIDVILGFTPEPEDILDFLIVEGTLAVLEGFDGIRGIAAPGSGVELGTLFTVSLGGELYYAAVTSAVPVPPSVWLFASGVIGLMSVARRRK